MGGEEFGPIQLEPIPGGPVKFNLPKDFFSSPPPGSLPPAPASSSPSSGDSSSTSTGGWTALESFSSGTSAPPERGWSSGDSPPTSTGGGDQEGWYVPKEGGGWEPVKPPPIPEGPPDKLLQEEGAQYEKSQQHVEQTLEEQGPAFTPREWGMYRSALESWQYLLSHPELALTREEAERRGGMYLEVEGRYYPSVVRVGDREINTLFLSSFLRGFPEEGVVEIEGTPYRATPELLGALKTEEYYGQRYERALAAHESWYREWGKDQSTLSMAAHTIAATVEELTSTLTFGRYRPELTPVPSPLEVFVHKKQAFPSPYVAYAVHREIGGYALGGVVGYATTWGALAGVGGAVGAGVGYALRGQIGAQTALGRTVSFLASHPKVAKGLSWGVMAAPTAPQIVSEALEGDWSAVAGLAAATVGQAVSFGVGFGRGLESTLVPGGKAAVAPVVKVAGSRTTAEALLLGEREAGGLRTLGELRGERTSAFATVEARLPSFREIAEGKAPLVPAGRGEAVSWKALPARRMETLHADYLRHGELAGWTVKRGKEMYWPALSLRGRDIFGVRAVGSMERWGLANAGDVAEILRLSAGKKSQKVLALEYEAPTVETPFWLERDLTASLGGVAKVGKNRMVGFARLGRLRFLGRLRGVERVQEVPGFTGPGGGGKTAGGGFPAEGAALRLEAPEKIPVKVVEKTTGGTGYPAEKVPVKVGEVTEAPPKIKVAEARMVGFARLERARFLGRLRGVEKVVEPPSPGLGERAVRVETAGGTVLLEVPEKVPVKVGEVTEAPPKIKVAEAAKVASGQQVALPIPALVKAPLPKVRVGAAVLLGTGQRAETARAAARETRLFPAVRVSSKQAVKVAIFTVEKTAPFLAQPPAQVQREVLPSPHPTPTPFPRPVLYKFRGREGAGGAVGRGRTKEKWEVGYRGAPLGRPMQQFFGLKGWKRVWTGEVRARRRRW